VERLVVPTLSPNLTRPCAPLVPAKSGKLEDILQAHAENMERAGICITRHQAIVDRLEALRKEVSQ